MFSSGKKLDELIMQYFKEIYNETQPEKNNQDKPADAKKSVKLKSAPPTISGLAFHLGFDSRQSFENYEANGKWALKLKRARLKIEAVYEQKLHEQPSSGAIFALKNMGWNERLVNKFGTEEAGNLLKVEIVQSGPKLAASEKEVIM